MPTIAEAIRHGQREIRRQEGVTFARLLKEYENLWWYVEQSIRRYEAQIEAAIDAGETVNPAWLRQQRWYTQLQQSVDDQLVRFNRSALGTLASAQTQAVGIATESARMFVSAVNISPGIVARVNPEAFERWVSALQPDSPLRGVLDRFDGRVTQAIERHITDGIGAGEGVNTMVRKITRDVGPTAQVGRLTTIARTETMRAYRGASFDQFSALGPDVIAEWEWMAAKSVRTCLACLSMDGRRFPFNQYPNQFHVSCRCVIRPIPHPRLVPGPLPQRETGAEWLARQDEATQRTIFGTQGRYDAYKAGVPLDEFVGIRKSRTWGDSVYVKPAGMVDVTGVPLSRAGDPPTLRVASKADAESVFRSAGDDMLNGDAEVAEAWNEYVLLGEQTNMNLRAGRPAAYNAGSGVERLERNDSLRMASFGDHTLDEGANVYRGVRFGMNETPEDFRGLAPGSVITDKGYVSTSFDREIAQKFTGGSGRNPGEMMFEVTMPENANYVSITGTGGGSPYSEVVLPPGTSFYVTKVEVVQDYSSMLGNPDDYPGFSNPQVIEVIALPPGSSQPPAGETNVYGWAARQWLSWKP